MVVRTLLSFTPRVSWQPVPQKEQTDLTFFMAHHLALNLNGLASSAPTGQTEIQEPQYSQSSLPSNGVPIFASMPRFTKEYAPKETISSQIRAHLPQWMQRFWSRSIKGFS